jgi:hypothetical protein
MGESKYKTIIPDVEFWKGMIPCQAACPVHTDAGCYVQLIAQGRLQGRLLDGAFTKSAGVNLRACVRRALRRPLPAWKD